MALTDRAAALAPYAQQLLYDPEVRDATRRAVGATRDACGRARGKSACQAVADRRLQRRVEEAVGAVCEVWSAITEPAPPKRHWGRWLAVVAVAVAGVFVAGNTEARDRVCHLLGSKDAKTASRSHEPVSVSEGG